MLRKLAVFFCCFCCFALAQAQENATGDIPFPLPSHEERLMEDARNPQTTIAQLAQLLENSNSNVRLAAARALGARGEAEALPLLEAARVANAGDAQLEAALQVALALVQSREQTPAERARKLQPFLTSTDETTQLEAILALRHIDAPAAADALWEYAVTHRQQLFVLAHALRALAEKNDERAVPLLAELDKTLFSTNPQIIVGGAGQARLTRRDVDALGEAYWRLRFQPLSTEERMRVFEEELNTGRVVGGLRLREAVLKLGPDILPYLRRFAADKTKPLGVRLWSVEILGLMRDAEAALILQQVRKEPDLPEELTEAAFRSLVSISDGEAIEELKSRLQEGLNGDPHKFTYQLVNALWAAHYLVIRANQSATALFDELLLPYLKRGDTIAATTAREAGDEKSVAPLMEMATDPQAPDEMSRQSVKHTAITSLGFIGARIEDKDNQVLFFLLKMTKDPNPRTRVVAVQALARMAGRGAMAAMLDMARQEKDNTALLFEVSSIYKAGGAPAVESLQFLQKQAEEDKNAYLLELSEEALLRLQREKRTG